MTTTRNGKTVHLPLAPLANEEAIVTKAVKIMALQNLTVAEIRREAKIAGNLTLCSGPAISGERLVIRTMAGKKVASLGKVELA